MSADVERCAFAVNADDEAQPCDRPATGWRWYQDCGHEPMLDVACELHANEGGQRMHEAEQAILRVRALAEHWQTEADDRGPDDEVYTAGVARMLRAALTGAQDADERAGASERGTVVTQDGAQGAARGQVAHGYAEDVEGREIGAEGFEGTR